MGVRDGSERTNGAVMKTFRVGMGICLALVLMGGTVSSVAQPARETPPDILAVQLRSQGYVCQNPQNATRDGDQSRPDQAVWLVTCEDGTYRMRLTPGMAAKVERLN
jgi:hypothetical protein